MTQSKEQQAIFAEAGNRAAALLLDLVLLGVVTGAAASAGLSGPYVFPALVFLYFAGMPLSPLQGTLGKWICRIKLCDRRGRRLTWRASAVRAGATMCWFGLPVLFGNISLFGELGGDTLLAIWLLMFALPWAPAVFLPRRESLFDLPAGSLVVRYKADTESIAGAEPAQKPAVVLQAGTVLLCLAIGAIFSVSTSAIQDMNRRARVAYAIAQTEPLREKIEVFQDREQRWPAAGELGVPEWTPYRDGGGYRLLADGSVLITFTVVPQLKGHSISLRPARTADGRKINWQCSADAGFKKGFLPATCR